LQFLPINCKCADKLLQTKLREKEIKAALKEKKQTEKQEKEEASLRASADALHATCPSAYFWQT
jgi:hypothetical protein